MEKKTITASLGLIHLIGAFEKREPCLFVINGEPYKVGIHGLERSDDARDTYNLKVIVVGMGLPDYQCFRFSTATYKGEWIGHFKLGHGSYADNVVTWENEPDYLQR